MIAMSPDWRGATLARLREVIHGADPDIVEDVKWRRPANPIGSAVFGHAGIVCAGIILKERARLEWPPALGCRSAPNFNRLAYATHSSCSLRVSTPPDML
jgi:hypothetical protein